MVLRVKGKEEGGTLAAPNWRCDHIKQRSRSVKIKFFSPQTMQPTTTEPGLLSVSSWANPVCLVPTYVKHNSTGVLQAPNTQHARSHSHLQNPSWRLGSALCAWTVFLMLASGEYLAAPTAPVWAAIRGWSAHLASTQTAPFAVYLWSSPLVQVLPPTPADNNSELPNSHA